jgi:hypothetical protein
MVASVHDCHFQLAGHGEQYAFINLLVNAGIHFWVGVAKDDRAESQAIIDVAIAVYVP